MEVVVEQLDIDIRQQTLEMEALMVEVVADGDNIIQIINLVEYL